jgi:hypothetical protein
MKNVSIFTLIFQEKDNNHLDIKKQQETNEWKFVWCFIALNENHFSFRDFLFFSSNFILCCWKKAVFLNESFFFCLLNCFYEVFTWAFFIGINCN